MTTPTPPLSQTAIARACDVSQATVSLVLRDPTTGRVSDATRTRILDFVADRPVRAVTRRRSRRIALLSGMRREPCTVGYLERLLDGVQQRAATHKRSVVVDDLPSGSDLADHRLVATCAGIIACQARITTAQVERVLAGGVPLVLLECDAGTDRCDLVRVDSTAAVVLAVRHLVEQGHRRIAWYGQRPAQCAWPLGRTHFERLAAWRTALEAFDLDRDQELLGVVDQLDADPDASRRVLERWFALRTPPTAVVCYNDIHALTLMREATVLGRRVPQDLSVVGIDAIAAGALANPALSTVDPALEDLGHAAVDQLMLRLEHADASPPRVIHCHPRLVARASVRCLSPSEGHP